ncbi:MAG TPA: c-type cytochrome domain-containing protein [Phycisphaerae bacterium]
MTPAPRGLSIVVVILAARAAAAQEQPPAVPPAPPTATQPAQPPRPDLDQILDALSKLDSKALTEHLAHLQSQQKQLADEAAALKQRLAQLDAQLAAVQQRVELLGALMKWLNPPPASAPPPASQPPAAPPAGAAPQPMAPAKDKPGGTTLATPPNYEQHVKSIFVESCAGCHNPDKARGGLIVDSYTALMQGGSSGNVIVPGDPDGSRLWRLVNHQEEPNMPYKQSKLPDEKLALIRRWIEGGARADVTSKSAAVETATPGRAIAMPTVTPGEVPIPKGAPKDLAPPTPHPPAVTALALSRAAPLAAVNGARQILIVDIEQRALRAALPFPEGRLQHLEFARDGRALLAAGGPPGQAGRVVLFDVISGQRLGNFGAPNDSVLSAAIDPFRELVAFGGTHKKVYVHDLLKNAPAYELTAHNDWITALAFSPDATLLATADRAGGLFVWEAESGRDVHILRGHNGAVHAVAFRPDSGVLASAGDDGTIRLWDMGNGKQIKQWAAHAAGALCIEFASDGRLCSGGADGLVKLWKPDGGAIRKFEGLGDWVYQVGFTSEGKHVIAGTWSGAVHVLDAENGKPLWQFDTNFKTKPDVALGH